MSAVLEPPVETIDKPLEELDTVTIRFAGDSGDGMQLTGTQFTNTSAIIGNDISTLPDFPAEIRAPAGSLPGVSGFQLNFSNHDIRTAGDQPNVLVAMNPAALKVNLPDLDAEHERAERQRRAVAQGDGSVQEFLRAGSALLALRPTTRTDAELDQRE